MTARSRILAGTPSSPPGTTSSSSTSSPPPRPLHTLDPDFAVILAALLCALICVLGLLAVVRCAWIRRFSSFAASNTQGSATANKGLKKKVLKALPSMTYRDDDEQATKLTECAICLAEFASGEEIRVLPQCGHGFHIGCIDTWLASHSSCPSCRQVLVAARCKNCGGGAGIQPEPRENHVNEFLP